MMVLDPPLEPESQDSCDLMLIIKRVTAKLSLYPPNLKKKCNNTSIFCQSLYLNQPPPSSVLCIPLASWEQTNANGLSKELICTTKRNWGGETGAPGKDCKLKMLRGPH